MSLLGEMTRRIHMLFHRDQLSRDLEEEMRLHIELRCQRLVDRGAPEKTAARSAQFKFGNTARIKEKSVMTWGSETLESFVSDVAYGARALLRSPALTIVAVLSLALGIGANTAIFSMLNAVMLRSLLVKSPQQLVLLGEGEWSGISDGFAITELYSYPFYRHLQQKNQVFSQTAALFSMLSTVHGFVEERTDSELMKVEIVSGSYFSTLGVSAQQGRTLSEADDSSEGDHPVCMVSHAFWKRSLASDPAVLNRRIKLGSTTFSIVGIAPAEFFGTRVGVAPDVWAPMSMVKFIPPNWDAYKGNYSEASYIIGRLKPGVSLDQATANVNLLFNQILRGFPETTLNQENLQKLAKAHVPLTPMATGFSALRREFSQPLKILMAVVALVLLIACANIANLLLARSTARARELAVRQALGARRSRIIRQLLTESLLLALIGGAIGIAFASVANRVLLRMVSSGSEVVPLDVSLDFRLLAFTFAVTVLTAILFGTIPAFRATRLDLNETLKDGRGPQSAGARNPLAKALVISQVALSLILMVGASLFLRSLVNLNNVDPGFNKENVLRLNIDSDSTGYKGEDPRLTALYQQIEDRVSALPGVQAASFSSFTFHEGSWNGFIEVPGMPVNHDIDVRHNVVGKGYFNTMQIPLVTGRAFASTDTSTSQRVAIISEHMAKTLFPAGNPLGRTYYLGGHDSAHESQVIGIAKDVKFGSLDEAPESIDYLPYTQKPQGYGDFEVRYTGGFDAMSTAVQQAIHSIDRTLPITDITTLDEQVARSVNNQRLVAQLSTFFGLLAVFLSAIGIYGLMSYMVSRRTNEIGIRMALGAARSNVSWLVIREIIVLVLVGIAIAIPAALTGDRLVASMLFGLKGTDTLSLGAAVTFLLVVAAAAGYFPARKASRVDPMEALRYE
jgi:predicted permease